MAGGVVQVTLGGASYHMKPSYGSMRDIETRTDFTITELLELVIAQRLKIQEAALVIWFACQAAGEGFDSIEAVGDVLFEEKLTSPALRKSLSQFLLNCLYAPAEAKKKFDDEVAPLLMVDHGPNATG